MEKEYINYALHFALWNLNTLAEPTHQKLFERRKNEWWQDLGVAGKGREYFYNKKEFDQYEKLFR